MESNRKHLLSTQALLAILSLTILVKLPWTQSFWLDETISIWIAQSNLIDLWQRSINFQGQSPLYFLVPWCLNFFGLVAEHYQRLVSVLLMIASLVVFYKIAVKLFNQQLAYFSVTCLIAYDPVLVAAVSVRPYALAFLTSLLALLFFTKWIEKPSSNYLALYVLTIVVAYYSHYLFILIAPIHLYFLAVFKKQLLLNQLKSYIIAMLSLTVFAIPGLFQLHSLWQKKTTLSFISTPNFVDLLLSYLPPYILVYLILSIILVLIIGYGKGLTIDKSSSSIELIPLFLLYLTAPVLFFVYSNVGSGSLFLPRLFLWFYPGLVLLLTYLIALVQPAKYRSCLICFFCLLMFIRESQRVWHEQHWKQVIASVNQSVSSNQGKIFYSGLIEAEQLGAISVEQWKDYLHSPLKVYSKTNDFLLIPGEYLKTSNDKYWDEEVLDYLEQYPKGEIIAYKRRIANTNIYTTEKISETFETAGYKLQTITPKNSVIQRIQYFKQQP